MGWNDRMDEPETYGAQYGRDFYSPLSRRSADVDADSNENEEE